MLLFAVAISLDMLDVGLIQVHSFRCRHFAIDHDYAHSYSRAHRLHLIPAIRAFCSRLTSILMSVLT